LEQALAVNVLGAFRLTKALFGALAASARNEGGALVINISSDAAVNAYPGWGAYSASKAALRHLTAIWAEEAKADRVGFPSIPVTWTPRCMRWPYRMPIGRRSSAPSIPPLKSSTQCASLCRPGLSILSRHRHEFWRSLQAGTR
jgi:hypothetical protein